MAYQDIKVLSLNVRGIRDPTKRAKIFHYLKRFNAYVILLQESHVLHDDLDLWKANWGRGDISINPLNEYSAGQVILLNDIENIKNTKYWSREDVKS